MKYVTRMKEIERRYCALATLSGRSYYTVFYSPVRPADILVLGCNPGGDPTTVHWDGVNRLKGMTSPAAASLSYFENDEHNMLDCDYPENNTTAIVLNLVGGDEAEFRRNVVKTNLAFRRSPGLDNVPKYHNGMTLTQAYAEARPFIKEIFDLVQPELVILEGSIFDHFMKAARLPDRKNNSNPIDGPIKTQHRGRSTDLYRLHRVNAPHNSSMLVAQLAHPTYHGKKYVDEGLDNRILRFWRGFHV